MWVSFHHFGFRKKHSTVDTLITIVEQIGQKVDKGDLWCVYRSPEGLWYSWSWNSILSKLSHYGVQGVANIWFRSYLSNRTQFVNLSSSNSILKHIKHGVPQSSVLGPLFFLFYINDLHYCSQTSNTYHFADDTHLLNFSATVKSFCGRFKAYLRVLVEWLKANEIVANF